MVAEAQRRPTEFGLRGPEHQVYIVAELSGNHGGSLENALRLIDEAKRAGADAVKFQCFEPLALAAKRVGVEWYGSSMTYEQLVSLYKRTHTPKSWFPLMITRCNKLGIAWFASAFSSADVAFLESVGCPRYKISAYEMLDGDLINAVVRTGKPIIMSVRPTDRVAILHATDYKGRLATLGLSDHGPAGTGTPIGRPMVERHIMLPGVPCEDQDFSSTPDEFADYVRAIRE